MKRRLLVFVIGLPMDYSEEFGYTVMLNHTETYGVGAIPLSHLLCLYLGKASN